MGAVYPLSHLTPYSHLARLGGSYQNAGNLRESRPKLYREELDPGVDLDKTDLERVRDRVPKSHLNARDDFSV